MTVPAAAVLDTGAMADVVTVPTAAVQCTNLYKRFGNAATALDNIDLHCPAGHLVVLVGPSGCGKTTLLRTIAGLEAPTRGRVWIDGNDITDQPAQRRDVAMVYQNYGLYPDKTVGGNMEFPLRMARVPKAERQARVAAAARLLRIEHLLDRRPAELSGGEKQRTGIGRAIVRSPRVLLMDEPLSNLDALLRTEMRAEIKQLQAALGTTIVYVTHDQVEAMTLADTLVVMRAGRIEQSGTPSDIYRRPATQFVAGFLGGMNLLPADRAGTTLRLSGGGVLRLPAGFEAPAGPLVVGFRPDEVTVLDRDDSTVGLIGEVVLIELTGPTQLVHVETPAGRVRATIPGDRQSPSGRVGLMVPPTALHVYPRP